MWHVATADAASVAPAHALHSSQDIRYISRFHTGNPIGTWLCSISKLTILNFQLFFSFVFYSIFYFLFRFFRILWTFQICLLTSKKNCMFVKYFIWFSYVFLSFLFCFSFYFVWKTSKKNSTHVVSFVCDSFLFLGNVLRELNTTTLVVWLMESRLLDSRSGSGWESADTKRTPRANETQCEQQVRVQMRPQLEATRGGCPCNTNMFERVARYTVTPLLTALLTRLWLLFATLRRLGGGSTASCTWRTKRTYEGIICWQSGWIRCLTSLEQLDARSVSNPNSLIRLDQCGSIDLFVEFPNDCLVKIKNNLVRSALL